MGCSGEGPATCPTGTEGQAYAIPIELLGDEDEGCARTPSLTSGSFPPGLSVNSGAARIEGTPTQAGSYGSISPSRSSPAPTHAARNARLTTSSSSTSTPGSRELTIGPEATTPGDDGDAVLLADDGLRRRSEDLVDQLGHASARPCDRRGDRSHLRYADGRRPIRLPGARQGELRHALRHQGARDRRCAIRLGDPRSGAVHDRKTRDRRGERPLRCDAHCDGRQRNVRVVPDERRSPTRAHPRGGCHLGNAHDRRRVRIHRDPHRLRRTGCELSRAHRRRAEARRLDAATPSRTAGGLLPGEAQDHRRRGAANVENRPRPAPSWTPLRPLRRHGLRDPDAPGPLSRDLRGHGCARREGDEEARDPRRRGAEAEEAEEAEVPSVALGATPAGCSAAEAIA